MARHGPVFRRWLRAAGFFSVVCAILFGALAWLLFSEGGLAWAAAAIERASAGQWRIEDARGRLAGPMSARALHIESADARYTVHDLRLAWNPAALMEGRLAVDSLSAARLEMRLPPDDAPPLLPAHLRLPLAVNVKALEIGVLERRDTAGGAVRVLARDVRAALSSDGERHRVDALSARLDVGELTAQASLGAASPFALDAAVQLRGAGTPAMRVSVRAAGTLEDLAADFEGRGEGFSAAGRARLRPLAGQPLAALRLVVRGLDPRAFALRAPHAQLALDADLTEKDGTLAGQLRLDNGAPQPFDRGGLPFSRIEARLALRLGEALRTLRLDALTLSAGASGGTLSGNIALAWPEGAAWPQAQADLRVARFDPAALYSVLRSARLDGRVALSGDAAVQNAVLALSDGVQRLDAEIVRRGETLDFSRLLLVRGAAELSGSGQVQLDAPRAWRFDGRLRHFDLAAFAKAPRSDLNAEIAGSGRLAPQYDGRLRFLFAKSRFAGEALDGSGDLAFSALDEAAGLLAAQGAARVRGSVDLRLGDSRLKLTGGWGGKEERLQVELKAPALARHELGLRGALELSATLSGGAARPDILLSASARGLGLPGHSVERFDVQGRLQGEALELDVTAEGYRQEGNARLARLHLTVAGTRERNRVHAEARLDAARSVTLAAAGALRAAPEDWRDTAWQGEIETLAVSGALPLHLSAPARVEASRQRISLGEAQVAFADGRIMLAESTWTPQSWTSRGRFSGIALRPGGLGGGDGETPLLRMGGEWSLAGAGHIDGWLRAARESGDWVLPGDLPRPLGLDDLRLEAKSAGGRLRAELAANGARIGRWQASATLPLARGPSGWGVAPHAALEGQVRAVVPDIAWAGPAIDGNLTSAGTLEIDAQLAGTLEAPWMRGHILGSGLAVGFIDQNVNLRDGVLKLRFEREILHIERLEFSASHDLPARSARAAGFSAKGEAGRIAVSGTLDLQRRRASLIAALTRLPLVQRPERWIVASGSGRLDYAGERLKFGADLRADAGFIAQAASGYPQLADDVVIVGREKPAQRGPRIESDISLDLGEHFHLRAAGLSARLSGRLRVRGNGSGPLSATGSIATQDAWFEAYGQRLTVERGIVNFQGPLDDPGLNVQALRKGGAVEAGVAVTGTAQHPVVRLISTPPVPDAEKLSWIVLGRAPDSGGADASLLFAAASAILGGQGEGVTQKIAQTLGVDELSLRQGKGGDPLTSQILTMGKRLSARAFLSYEQGLMASAGVMKLTVTLTSRISIVTRAGGDNAVDVFYNFTFD